MRKRKQYVETLEEFNEILMAAYNRSNLMNCTYEQLRYVHKVSLATHSCYQDKQVTIEVTTQFYDIKRGEGLKPTTYIFRKDGQYKLVMDGSSCFMIAQKYYKVPDFRDNKEIVDNIGISEKGSFIGSASPIVGYNRKYDSTEHDVYVYDLNSAYAVQLMNKLPNTEKYVLYGRIENDNQVGFLFDSQLTMIKSKGLYADIIFDLVDSPYKTFARKYYDMKKGAKSIREKLKAKNILNLSVGYWQRINPFLRAYVVHSCNNYIKSLIDENTCMWNTDAIYSTKERPDLELGDDIGQFKLEYKGKFRQKGNNYQKVDSVDISYRGIPKSWFGVYEDWNILTDGLPTGGNMYRLDTDIMQIVVNI